MSESPQANMPQRRDGGDIACIALLLIGLYLILGPRLDLRAWHVEPGQNAALEEALQWRHGKLAIEKNVYETARVGEHRYNVVGLAFTLISVVATLLNDLTGGTPGQFFSTHYVLFVVVPIPLVAYWAFRANSRSPITAALLTAYLMIGTPLEPVLRACRNGDIYYINHALCVTGLLLMAGDLLGRRRIWPAIIGLLLAAWSRQMTIIYAIPLFYVAWRNPVSNVITAAAQRSRRGYLAAFGILIAVAVPMALSYEKFGNPLDSGYARIYEGRTDPTGLRAQSALFSTHYIPMHLAAMNTTVPAWDFRGGGLYSVLDHTTGGSIWLTSPLLLGIFLTLKSWWRDPARRALMLASIAVMAGLWTYHTTGSDESGFYRYALDFIPFWLVVIAPALSGPRARSWLLAALAFSGLYFRMLP